jgi:hypothetical protein
MLNVGTLIAVADLKAVFTNDVDAAHTREGV